MDQMRTAKKQNTVRDNRSPAGCPITLHVFCAKGGELSDLTGIHPGSPPVSRFQLAARGGHGKRPGGKSHLTRFAARDSNALWKTFPLTLYTRVVYWHVKPEKKLCSSEAAAPRPMEIVPAHSTSVCQQSPLDLGARFAPSSPRGPATSRPVTTLDSALTKNDAASPLESAITKSLDLKFFRMRTYRKHRGVEGLIVNLPHEVEVPSPRDHAAGSAGLSWQK
jgi:hypothetical protein